MKALVICNTYLMLLNAIQLKRYELLDDDVDIILSDYTIGMGKISKNLRGVSLFNNVFFCKIKNFYQGGTFFHKIIKTLSLFDSEKKVKNRFGMQSFDYDIFIFCNYDIPATLLYTKIRQNNPNLTVWRYEEGYSTYLIENDYQMLMRIYKILHFFLNVPDFYNSVSRFYLYEPSLLQYSTNIQLSKLTKYEKKKSDINLLNRVFGYDGRASKYENYKYIVFEESFCVDHIESVNDEYIFKEIISYVGKENLIIKLHPRNEINRFKDFNVDLSDIPWEVIYINGQFDDSIFLTYTSGAVIGPSLWLNDEYSVIFLYRLSKNKLKMVRNGYERFICDISKGNDNWRFPCSVQELYEMLDE